MTLEQYIRQRQQDYNRTAVIVNDMKNIKSKNAKLKVIELEAEMRVLLNVISDLKKIISTENQTKY